MHKMQAYFSKIVVVTAEEATRVSQVVSSCILHPITALCIHGKLMVHEPASYLRKLFRP